ncbi:MAG: enoyl-CoA hydratase/isomerase family protein [Chloroflexi bacterium]|nr:enoyl-CoA hydratase/isomerase family protein [Chloroflexota bacterium]
MTGYQSIELTQERSIATLTLKRPDKMNALSDDLLREMQTALDELEKDVSVRALIVTGAGRAFCAGFDLTPREQPLTSVQDWRSHVELGNNTWWRIWRSRLPVIAAVNGYCLGGGCDLSMVCDLTIAADTAEFGEPEIQFQSSPPFLVMPWVLGLKKTKELLLTGDRIAALEAERIGLVNKVVPAADLLGEAHVLAMKLAKIPPPAMELNKQMLNRAYDIRGFRSTVEYGAEMFALTLLSDSEEARAFFAVATAQGLKAAFKWRDARFQSDE